MKMTSARQRQERIDHLLQVAIQQARDLNIPVSRNIGPTVKINPRATGRLGQIKKRGYFYYIELSEFMLQTNDHYILQTLAHEVLHSCPDCMNHGPRWKRYAAIMNNAHGYDIARTNDAANMGVVREYKYTLQCQNCGKTWHRQKASHATKNPHRYHCQCGGELKLI